MFDASNPYLRILIFASVLVIMTTLEFVIPKRQLNTVRSRRWVTNISIAAFGNFLIRMMGTLSIPIVALSAAVFSEVNGTGLFNILDLPLWLNCILTIIIFDFAIYVQHVLSHRIPVLWRMHRVHHADTDFDVTTAVRFHPLEIVLSMLYKVVLVFVLGPSVLGVFLFEVILSSCAMFNHANIHLPQKIDRVLRIFVVTPDMHRVHHSIRANETNSNYGFNIPLWDYIFGTYVDQPAEGHNGMTIGLVQYQSRRPTEIIWSLFLPFKSGVLKDRQTGARAQEENIEG